MSLEITLTVMRAAQQAARDRQNERTPQERAKAVQAYARAAESIEVDVDLPSDQSADGYHRRWAVVHAENNLRPLAEIAGVEIRCSGIVEAARQVC